jgi:PAS domain S-box-containing protein
VAAEKGPTEAAADAQGAARAPAFIERERIAEELRRRTRQLDERVKELSFLCSLAGVTANPDLTPEEVLRNTARGLPGAWQHPEVACARITLDDRAYASAGWRQTEWRQQATIRAAGRPVGSLEICYTQERPPADEGPFLAEERALLEAIAQELGEYWARRQAEEKLLRSEAEWRSLAAHSPSIIMRLDRQGAILYISRAVGDISGTIDETVGRTVYDYILPADHPTARKALERAFDAREPTGFEARVAGPGGIEHWFDARVGPVVLNNRVVAAGMIVTDITQRKQLEEQLRRAQKLEAVGQLAAGVAHEFNNVLMGISGYAQLLQEAAVDSGAKKELGEIRKLSERGGRMAQQLMAFSRREEGTELMPLMLAPVVKSAVRLLRRAIPENVEIIQHIPADTGTAAVNPGQVEQIVVNLATNARDAMPDGGRLTIETANVDLPVPGDSDHAGVPAGRYVMLAVSDTGCGMDDRTRDRAFEPFFTTKPPGKGTGLGLSAVFGLVENHHGRLSVRSSPGKGTCVRVFFPRREPGGAH